MALRLLSNQNTSECEMLNLTLDQDDWKGNSTHYTVLKGSEVVFFFFVILTNWSQVGTFVLNDLRSNRNTENKIKYVLKFKNYRIFQH